MRGGRGPAGPRLLLLLLAQDHRGRREGGLPAVRQAEHPAARYRRVRGVLAGVRVLRPSGAPHGRGAVPFVPAARTPPRRSTSVPALRPSGLPARGYRLVRPVLSSRPGAAAAAGLRRVRRSAPPLRPGIVHALLPAAPGPPRRDRGKPDRPAGGPAGMAGRVRRARCRLLRPRPGRRRAHRPGTAADRRRLPAPASPARTLPAGRQQPLAQDPGRLVHRPRSGPAARSGRPECSRAAPALYRRRPRAAATGCRRILPVHAQRARPCPPGRHPPRSDDTIERRLSIVRDLAVFLAGRRGKNDWATTDVHDIEAFPATLPGSRRSRLTALRHFFTWARASKLVLTDPTRGLSARQPRGYCGPTVPLGLQRQLFRRWTSGGVHPHEALTGLLTLIHGASNEELRALTISDIDPAGRAVRLGRRPQPVPLDPATWTAVERCLTYHDQLRTANPHLLVTRKTRATRAAASDDYSRNVLRAAGVQPRLLRCTRLAQLTVATDPKLVSAAFGIHPQAATHYLAGHVDDGRLHGTGPDDAGPQ